MHVTRDKRLALALQARKAHLADRDRTPQAAAKACMQEVMDDIDAVDHEVWLGIPTLERAQRGPCFQRVLSCASAASGSK